MCQIKDRFTYLLLGQNGFLYFYHYNFLWRFFFFLTAALKDIKGTLEPHLFWPNWVGCNSSFGPDGLFLSAGARTGRKGKEALPVLSSLKIVGERQRDKAGFLNQTKERQLSNKTKRPSSSLVEARPRDKVARRKSWIFP